jgi:hypothetical protein
MKESYDRFVTARSNFASHGFAIKIKSVLFDACYNPKQTRFGTNSGNKMGSS